MVRNTLQTASGDKTVSLDIGSTLQQGVTASFQKITPEFPTALTILPGVALRHRSSIARTVYVESPESLARPVVQINLRENGASVAVATVYLNANGNAAPLDEPDDPNDRITSGEPGGFHRAAHARHRLSRDVDRDACHRRSRHR